MGTIYENITKLCDENGIKPGKMCGDLSLSRSLMSDLKMGRKKGITDKTAVKIANYFNVSIDRVIGGTETEKAPADDGEDLAEYLQDLRERPETRTLLEASRGMTKEQVEKMAEFAKMLRGGD